MSVPSIRRSLLIRTGLGVGLLLALLCIGVFLLAKESLYREIDESITQTAAMLANQVELEDEGLSFEWKEGVGTNNALIEESLFQFWNETTGVTTRSTGLQNRDLPRFRGENGKPWLRTIHLPNGHRARAIGLRIYPFVLAEEIEIMKQSGRVIDPKTLPHTLVVARDSEPVHHTLKRLRWILIGGSLLTLALGFILIEKVVRITLRPIDDLARQMKGRTGAHLDSALDVPEALPVELAGLAENFDSLLGRVAATRERERDFIRHAAHELRTPIAGLQATTELALSQTREASAYASYLKSCQASAIDLGELVKRLTALSRIGQADRPAARDRIDAAAILKRSAESFTSTFAQRDLRLEPEIPDSGWLVLGDNTLLRIVFSNLMDNAASYATPGTAIRCRCEPSDGQLEIHISNTAPDIPDNLDRLFEPLFRKDSSRTDVGNHLGIGLTLSQEAATAMGATLTAQKTGDHGIEFVLKMPLAK